MKGKYIVISVILTLILFVALIYVERNIGGVAGQTEVLIVKQNLNIDKYTKLDQTMFEVKKVQGFLTENAVVSFSETTDKYALDDLYSNEILRKVKIGDKNATPIMDIASDKRGIAIPLTSLADGVAGQARKGTFVDILFTSNPTTEEPVIKTETVLEKVKVLGVTDSNGLFLDDSGSGQIAAVLVAVTPQEAHMITNKERKGKFRIIISPENASEYEKVIVR
jgi:Flp pilus assembly protein CpaB